MLHDSPLRSQHEMYAQSLANAESGEQAGRPGAALGQRVASHVEYIPYGPPDDQGNPVCEIPASFDSVELEYSAIRRGAGMSDSPHRGTLLIGGSDRRNFLNRMLTQELKALSEGNAAASFWLNRKGRIEADLFLIELGDRILVDLDIHQAARTVETLNEFLFSEDVQITNVSSEFHHLAIHGKRAGDVLAACGREYAELDPMHAATLEIAGAEAVVARRDQTGEIGLELIVPYDRAATVWEQLVKTEEAVGQGRRRVRPIGWHAFNIARIEAGTPLFNIDFGPNALPHETGLLHDRVSFTKGCYLGQEIVARMENLGKPKQMLVGLRMRQDRLPEAGAQVFARQDDGLMGDEIGVITSSTLSPMKSAAPIAFAMLRSAHADVGQTVLVNAEGEQVEAVVGPLRFWPPDVHTT